MDKLAAFIFDFVIAVFVVFISVLIYFGLRSETVINTLDNEITEDFLSEIKENGSMTPKDYESFLQKLSYTDVLYDISFEHKYKVTEPEYRMRTIEEIIAAQKAEYKGENIYHYKDVITSKPIVTDPIDNSGLTMNTETNESVLAHSVGTPASAGHVHTPECYGAHTHKAVYGTTDLSNVPVYIYRAFQYDYDLNAYTNNYKICCSICGQTLMEIVFAGSWPGYKARVKYYSKGSSNQVVCTTVNITSESGYYDSKVTNFIDTLDSLIRANYQDSIGGSTGIISRDFAWASSGLSGFPVFNTSGAITGYTPVSCCNIYGHPDTSGCYPVGKMTKVTYEVSRSSNTSDSTASLQIRAHCADCGRQLLFIECRFPINYSSSMRSSGLSIMFYDYTASGGIIDKSFISTTYGGDMSSYGGSSSDHEWQWDSMNGAILHSLENTVSGFPKATYNYLDSGNYTFRTPVMDPGILKIPVRYRTGLQATVFWEPYRGCLHCGAYGSNYACGELPPLLCNQKVVRIEPTHPVQSVYIGEALITAVRATYLDGRTSVVIAGTTFSTAVPGTNQTAVLSYRNAFGNTKTCNITVNVIPKTRTCAHGHTYNLNNNGSDPGCPFCKAYVSNIRVVNPTTSTMTITIGTTLQQNGVKLLVTYYDGHTETITSGYEDNLDQQYLGTKLVTIGYKGATTQIMVTTVCAKMTCDRCGFVYELYPDGTNPGCPRCISKTPVFTGNVLVYEEVNYSNEILEELYENGKYSFHTSDTLSISVENKTSCIARNILNLIFQSSNNQWISLKKSEAIKAN